MNQREISTRAMASNTPTITSFDESEYTRPVTTGYGDSDSEILSEIRLVIGVDYGMTSTGMLS